MNLHSKYAWALTFENFLFVEVYRAGVHELSRLADASGEVCFFGRFADIERIFLGQRFWD